MFDFFQKLESNIQYCALASKYVRIYRLLTGVRAKLAADPSLRALLLATGTHPLLSLKGDRC
jgi:hypothetical protein